MSDSENIPLAEFQALRRELADVLERQDTLIRHMIRLADGYVDLSQQMLALKTALFEIRGQVAQLESQGSDPEILDILRRLDESDREQREPARQRRELREQWLREDREAQQWAARVRFSGPEE